MNLYEDPAVRAAIREMSADEREQMSNLSPTAQTVAATSEQVDVAMREAYEAEGTPQEGAADRAYEAAVEAHRSASQAHREARESWREANPITKEEPMFKDTDVKMRLIIGLFQDAMNDIYVDEINASDDYERHALFIAHRKIKGLLKDIIIEVADVDESDGERMAGEIIMEGYAEAELLTSDE